MINNNVCFTSIRFSTYSLFQGKAAAICLVDINISFLFPDFIGNFQLFPDYICKVNTFLRRCQVNVV